MGGKRRGREGKGNGHEPPSPSIWILEDVYAYELKYTNISRLSLCTRYSVTSVNFNAFDEEKQKVQERNATQCE